MKAFAPVERFVQEVSSHQLKPGYVFIGDEGFFRRTCRDAILKHLIPEGMRDFSLYEFDLESSEVVEILDRARTPSLMASFQVFFVRGVKALYGRGKHDAEFAAIASYMKNPNPDALLILIADHISIPADLRRMEMTDKERYERIRETLGEHFAVIEFARVEEGEAIKWLNETAALHSTKIDPEASRELVDSLGGDMMMISNELEKLLLYVGEKKRITLGDVETMVLAAKQRTLYELTDALSSHNRARSLEILDAMLSTGDGDEAAIGHLYMLARTFRQMLVHPGAQRARHSRSLPGAVAGLPHPALCRRRRHPPVAPIQVAPRTDPGHPPDLPRRCRTALQSSQQAPHPGEFDPRPRR